MVGDHTLPQRGSPDFGALLLFILALEARTEYVLKTSIELERKASDVIYGHSRQGAIGDSLLGKTRSNPEILQEKISLALQVFPVVVDLKGKLLLNQTGVPFITSDNPVVRYNQFLEHRVPGGTNTGLATKGLQVFLPVAPDCYFMLYDQGVYVVGERNDEIVALTRWQDISQLNRLQFVNANHNLYFNDAVKEEYLHRLVTDSYAQRRKEQVKVDELMSTTDKNSSLIVIQNVEPRCGFAPSFINIKRQARRWVPSKSAAQWRNKKIKQICDVLFPIPPPPHAVKVGENFVVRKPALDQGKSDPY